MLVDSSEVKSVSRNSPQITVAELSEGVDSISVSSVITFNRGGQNIDVKSSEFWSLEDDGNILSIQQHSGSFRGERRIRMIYEREHVRK